MFRPRQPVPQTLFASENLIGRPDMFEATGTTRQGRPEYRLLEDVQFYKWTIPAGFVFDIHSLPRLLRGWQPKSPAWWIPALGHDWLLASGLASLKEANRAYLQAMRDIGVAGHHRFIGFKGVELGRYFFPDRISQVDPDNIALIERVTGQPVGLRVSDGAPSRAALFQAVRTVSVLTLKSKGVLP